MEEIIVRREDQRLKYENVVECPYGCLFINNGGKIVCPDHGICISCE